MCNLKNVTQFAIWMKGLLYLLVHHMLVSLNVDFMGRHWPSITHSSEVPQCLAAFWFHP